MMLLLFSPTPTGGVRTAVVPNNGGGLVDAAGNARPAYAVNGIALPRQAPTLPPVFLAQAGLTGTYAHELGHTFRLDHAPCPPLPGMPGTGETAPTRPAASTRGFRAGRTRLVSTCPRGRSSSPAAARS